MQVEENNNQNVEQKTVSQPAKAKKKKEGKGFGGWVNAHKAEFKKIVWPNRKEVSKETTTVIIVSLLVGAVIFGMDTALNYGYTSLVGALSGQDTGNNTVIDDNGISIDGNNENFDFEIVTGVEDDGNVVENGENVVEDADVDANDTTAVQ